MSKETASRAGAKWLVSMLVVMAPVAADAQATPGAAPVPYAATYQFKRGALRAEVVETLALRGGEYVYDSIAKGQGFAALAQSAPAVQHSRFTVAEGRRVRPAEFEMDDGTKKGEKSTSIVFDWDAAEATVTTVEGTTQLPLAPGTLDVVTVSIQFALDLAAGGADARYRVIDGKRLRDYLFTREGEQTLKLDAGVFKTHKYRLERDGRDSILFHWHAPALSFLAVRVEEFKGGKTRYRKDLISVEGLGQ